MSIVATLGTVLRRARTDAGLSQRQLADRLGKSQSWVSATESHAGQLSLEMLQAWGDACQREVTISMSAKTRRWRVLPDLPDRYRVYDEIVETLDRLPVRDFSLFSSFLRGWAHPSADKSVRARSMTAAALLVDNAHETDILQQIVFDAAEMLESGVVPDLTPSTDNDH